MPDQPRAALCGPCEVGNCAGHGRSFRNGQPEPCEHDHPSPAVDAARGWIVPLDSGGAQIEWHQDGWDVEIEFTKNGRIEGVYVGRAT